MPRRRQRGGARTMKLYADPIGFVPQAGGNIFGSIWSGIKKGANWVKDNKIISRFGRYVPVVGQIGAPVAGMVGLGRRTRRTRVIRI